ncbi:hypothetical protein Ccrd_010240 [Cynara cardunculus var. scolymus]|uniref:Uncharacterized protein n=1 Tax=Cynara cardunculus var. scolymus TaxID=59895 RepID=A0A103YLH4_CYNCS|nr:hypothetical protein Ccrd_010240 [Cynara cardunculus var. scolymus]
MNAFSLIFSNANEDYVAEVLHRLGLEDCFDDVGSSERKKSVDYALESIHNIREALSGLWESVMKSKDVCDSQKIAIETTVKA